MKAKKLVLAVCTAAALACSFAFTACGDKVEETRDPVKLNADKTSIVVTGQEWGPVVNAVVVKFKDKVSGVSKDTFTVSTAGKKRTVTDAYLCDATGKKVAGESEYVAIEMKSPNVTSWGADASPFAYDQTKQVNNWAEKYTVKLTVAENQKFKVGTFEHKAKDNFSYDVTSAEDRLVPQTATWKKDVYNYKGEGKDINLSRASWTPEGAAADGVKNPLIIWLHGGGEGGTDIDIALLGNEVTGLTSDNQTNVQHYFKTGNSAGAYVLAVQSPTMWMDALGDGKYGNSQANGTPTGEKQLSYYTEALWGAITAYVESNPDIDTDRIYVGGCSNGGYMTMNLAFEHGDYFAAYYPVCQGYMSGNISDDMVQSIKDYNMWFLLSAEDNTLKPDKYTLPLYVRLIEAGAEKVHLTYKENVTGADAAGNKYDGHWSWIWAFNDDVKKEFDNSKITGEDYLTPANCNKDGNMWQWISEQTRPAGAEEVPAEKPANAVETYELQAESAVITDGKGIGQTGFDPSTWQPTYGEIDVKPTIETGNEYTTDGSTGAEVTNVGYFYGTGASITWTVYAEEECDVTLTLRAAAAIQDQSGVTDWTTGAGLKFKEVDMSAKEFVELKVNNADAALTGILPGINGLDWTSMSNPSVYKNFGTATASVHLKKGANAIVINATNQQGGINIDKLTISGTTVKTYYVITDNSDRVPQQS